MSLFPYHQELLRIFLISFNSLRSNNTRLRRSHQTKSHIIWVAVCIVSVSGITSLAMVNIPAFDIITASGPVSSSKHVVPNHNCVKYIPVTCTFTFWHVQIHSLHFKGKILAFALNPKASPPK